MAYRSMAYHSMVLAALVALSVLPVTDTPILAQSQPENNPSFLQKVLDHILGDDDDEEDERTTTRPLINGICLITPANPSDPIEGSVIWHDRPTFVWQGDVGKLSVLDTTTNTVLWEHVATPEENSIRYDGSPLQAGQTYEWHIYEATNLESPQRFLTFQLLPDHRRLSIASELEHIAQNTDGTEEAIAIAHADYYMNQDPALKKDAIQALFRVQVASSELAEARADIIEHNCSESTSESTL